MGLELYFISGIAFVILFLWGRGKYYKNKAKKTEQARQIEKRVREHNEAVHKVERKRAETKDERIKEAVKNAEDDEFSDFYDNDS